MREILPFLVALPCLLMMFFMMRGMHGGSNNETGHMNHSGHAGHGAAADERVAALEREVAQLKAERRGVDRSEAGQ